MGCTLTVVLVANGWGVMGHVGDSRLYVCRKGAVHQLSEDHSYAAELARAGVIPAGEVRKHRYAHVLTRSVGTRPAVNADVLRFSLLPEDRLLLCSDGLSNYLADSTWLAKELAEEDLDGIPAELVRFANEAGGADNITALVVGVEAEPEGPLLAAAELAQAQLTALEGCFLFSGLSLARKAWVLSHCVLREHAPGLLVSEGAALPGLVLVVRGAAQVERDGAIVGALGPGQQFGASALLAPRAARANVSMAESSRTLLMSPESLRTLARSRPRLGVLLLRRLARELGRALDERVARESNPSPELAP